ncbi:MAG: hypothetical protein ABI700_27690 [Chloroflexota bacterium]
MRRFRSSISLLLCIAVFASLFSGFAASAAPLKPHTLACEFKPANLTAESAAPQQNFDCCPVKEKISAASTESRSSSPVVAIDCCEAVSKLSVQSKSQIGASPVLTADCCETEPIIIRGKVQIGVNQADPCAPVVDGTCGLTYPAGSVVGEIPFDQPAFYAPGLLAPGVTINAGTYWVTGLGEADNGDKFYQIVVACQFLFVRANDIVPSYQAPWSGQPLPTTPPVES